MQILNSKSLINGIKPLENPRKFKAEISIRNKTQISPANLALIKYFLDHPSTLNGFLTTCIYFSCSISCKNNPKIFIHRFCSFGLFINTSPSQFKSFRRPFPSIEHNKNNKTHKTSKSSFTTKDFHIANNIQLCPFHVDRS